MFCWHLDIVLNIISHSIWWHWITPHKKVVTRWPKCVRADTKWSINHFIIISWWSLWQNHFRICDSWHNDFSMDRTFLTEPKCEMALKSQRSTIHDFDVEKHSKINCFYTFWGEIFFSLCRKLCRFKRLSNYGTKSVDRKLKNQRIFELLQKRTSCTHDSEVNANVRRNDCYSRSNLIISFAIGHW